MTSTIDARYAALAGHGGSTHDRIRGWLMAETGATGTIADLWDALFDKGGIPAGARPERMLAWLQQQGVTGRHLTDAQFSYWVAQAEAMTLADSSL